ncbi:hypothetical protein D9M68_754560 [compost metagenome]
MFLQCAQALCANAMTQDGAGRPSQRLGGLRPFPAQFADGEAGSLGRKAEAAGRRGGRRQHVGALRRAGALRVDFLFLAALDLGGARSEVGNRLCKRRRRGYAHSRPDDHCRPPTPHRFHTGLTLTAAAVSRLLHSRKFAELGPR